MGETWHGVELVKVDGSILCQEEITAGKTTSTEGTEGLSRIGTHLRHDFCRHVSWDVHGNLIVNVLGLIVIESHIFDYFTWISRFDICIAKDTNLDFSGNHTLLNQDTTIIFESQINRCTKLCFIFSFRNPNR